MIAPADFSRKVDNAPTCHLWVGASNNRGYGIVVVDGKKELAHRVAYEAKVGPIPDGMVLDHLCRSRNCVNPDHLEPVTHAENSRRGRAAASLAIGDTCINGHLIGPEDLYRRASGATECHHCRRSGAHRINGARKRTSVRKSVEKVRAGTRRAA